MGTELIFQIAALGIIVSVLCRLLVQSGRDEPGRIRLRGCKRIRLKKEEWDMGLRKILTDKDPALHKVCKPVTSFDWRLHKLLDDMRDTLEEAQGVGLAAPQVGILRRVVIVDTGEEILELVNPTMIATDGEQVGPEGCLSVPGKYGLVKRPYYAKVRAQDRYGEWYEAEGEELIGRCFCHELDHLDGIVYTEVMERFLSEEELMYDDED